MIKMIKTSYFTLYYLTHWLGWSHEGVICVGGNLIYPEKTYVIEQVAT